MSIEHTVPHQLENSENVKFREASHWCYQLNYRNMQWDHQWNFLPIANSFVPIHSVYSSRTVANR